MSIEKNLDHLKLQDQELLSLNGRVLYLSDSDSIKKQLDGEDLQSHPLQLISEISTDEIAPNKICLQYTGKENELLGMHLLTGLRGGMVGPGEILKGGFEVLVAGPSFGRGSSRYHAPLALKEAGIKILITSPERIFAENLVNAGIHVLPPDSQEAFTLLEDRQIAQSKIDNYLSPVSKEIMKAGSLMKYLKSLDEGKIEYPTPSQNPRQMTMIEKILAKKVLTSNNTYGVNFVKPGEEIIARPDKYYGYELQTTVVRRIFTNEFDDQTIRNPSKAYLFNDHTALIQKSEAARIQQYEQKVFADQYGIVNFENTENGSPAIYHTKMLEDFAKPGELILGNDSHTCTLGAVNSFAVGKGAADLAGALAYDKMVIKIPETIKVNLKGQLTNGATMKDAILSFGSQSDLKEDRIGSGRVFEFSGDVLNNIPFDEQLKLTNMAVELQAFTGIIEPNVQMFLYLAKQRKMAYKDFATSIIQSDSRASYSHTLTLDLSLIEPTVATPGDTQNGKPLSEIRRQNIAVQKAYIGSCTHGTPEDLRQAAEVIKDKKIAKGVTLYVQASSEGNLQEAKDKKYVEILLEAGAQLLPIGCGACMNAGPGSPEEGEVGIFATNRNYPGRTGKGQTYLANPKVVAASAIKGFICGPDEL